MSDDDPAERNAPDAAEADPRDAGERDDRITGLSDLVKRAVAAGVGAARNSKEEVVRAAATEMRGWLDHLDLEKEIAKALQAIKIEIKTEVRFVPAGDGSIKPEVSNAATVKKA